MHINKQRGVGTLDIIVPIAVIILGLIAAAPLITSFQVEKVYTSIVEGADKEFDGVTITLSSYTRGWFDSKATYVIKDLETGSNILKVSDDIQHGPIFISRLFEGQSPLLLARIYGKTDISAPAQAMESNLGINEIFKGSMETTINWAQECHTKGIIAAIDSKREDINGRSVFIMDNATFDINYNCAEVDLTGSFNLPVIYVAKNDEIFRLDEITVETKQRMTSTGLPEGSFDFSVGGLLISKEAEKLSAQNMNLAIEQSISGDAANFSFLTSVELVDVEDKIWGPGKFHIELNRLNASKLAELSDSAQQAASMGPMGALSLIPDLLSDSPEIVIQALSLKTPDGLVEGKGKAGIADVPKEDLANIFILMNSVIADASIQAPVKVVKQFTHDARLKQMLEAKAQGEFAELTEEELEDIVEKQVADELGMYEALGRLRTDGDNYFVDVEVKDGKLLVNGQPMN